MNSLTLACFVVDVGKVAAIRYWDTQPKLVARGLTLSRSSSAKYRNVRQNHITHDISQNFFLRIYNYCPRFSSSHAASLCQQKIHLWVVYPFSHPHTVIRGSRPGFARYLFVQQCDNRFLYWTLLFISRVLRPLSTLAIICSRV